MVCFSGQGFDVWFNAEREGYDLDMPYGYPPVGESSYEEAFHLGEEALQPTTRHRSGVRHYPRGYEDTTKEQRRLYRSEVEVSFHPTLFIPSPKHSQHPP